MVVRATDANGKDLKGQIVNFRVVEGGGQVFAGASITNRHGIAQERWTLGASGPQTLEVRAVHTETGEALTFAVFTATLSLLPGFALDFAGAQSTETPDADDLDLTTTFTIEMWIKPGDVLGGLQHLLSKWGCCTEASYHLGISENDGTFILVDGFLQLGTRASGSNSFILSNTLLQDGVWQHVAATFDNGEGRLYINGQLDAIEMGMRVPQISPTLVSLGRQKSVDGFIGKHYDGVMDEVRIWNVTRTASEIAANKDVKLMGNEAGLVAYWRLDEGSGDTAFDATSNAHDMRLGNAIGPDAGDPTWVAPGKL